MSEDIVPHYTLLSQLIDAAPPPPLPIQQRALQEVMAHPERYPVRVQPRKQDGRFNVTMHLPSLVDGEWHSLKQKWVCTDTELFGLHSTIATHDDTMIAHQYLRAIYKILPDTGPKRRDLRSLVTCLARRDAQEVYPLLQALLPHPDHWLDRFRLMMDTVTQILHREPNARELTAWLVEQRHAGRWDVAGVIPPTQGMGHADWDGGTRFANRYIYTRKHRQSGPVWPPIVAALMLEGVLRKRYPLTTFV